MACGLPGDREVGDLDKIMNVRSAHATQTVALGGLHRGMMEDAT